MRCLAIGRVNDRADKGVGGIGGGGKEGHAPPLRRGGGYGKPPADQPEIVAK